MRLRLRSRSRTNAAGEPLRFRNLTAAGPSTKEREKLAERGEAMKDGSFPIRNVEDLRNAIQSVGRAKDYDAAKRWIMKRARELDAEDELPEDWTNGTTAAGVPGPVLYAQMSETQTEDNARYAEELCPACGSTLLGEADGLCGACGHRRETITAAFDESKVVRHPKGTKVAGKVGGGRFAVKTNAAGRHEVVSPEGKKVAETTEQKDAEKIASEKNAAYGLDGGSRMPPEQLLGLTIDQADEMLRDGRLGQADYEAFRHVWAKNAVDPESPNARGWIATPEDPAVLDRVKALDERVFLDRQARDLGFERDARLSNEELSAKILTRVSEPGFRPGVDDVTVVENAVSEPAGPFVEGERVILPNGDQATVVKTLRTVPGKPQAYSLRTDSGRATWAPETEMTRVESSEGARMVETVREIDEAAARSSRPIEGPFKYPSGWEGRYDPVEGRYIGMDDIYMPADFDPNRDAGSAMVQPARALAPMRPRDVFVETARGSIRRGLASDSSTERIKAQTAQNVLDRIESGEIEFTDQDAITLSEGMNRVEGNADRSVNSLMLEKVVGVGIMGPPSARSGETTTVENALSMIRQPGSTPSDKLLRIAGYANRPATSRSYGGGLADYSEGELADALDSTALTPEGAARIARELAARGFARPVSLVSSAEPCGECEEMEALVAAIPVKPPAEWFELPKLDGPTPMTVTDDGRIFGHAAVWGTCHLGNPRGAGVCVQPPRSQSDYGLFHLGEVETASGARVPVGQITLDTGHAPLGASARNAAAHYDHTGTCAADVVVGEDEHGIVFSGALRPDMTPERARTLMGSKISGDWRGGELVGLLAVNVPGFPVPRARLVASADGVDEVLALVAAGVVVEPSPFAGLRPEAVVEILAARAEGIDALAELAGA